MNAKEILIENLAFSDRVKSKLNRLQIFTLGDLLSWDVASLSKRRGIGEKTIYEIEYVVRENGYSIRTNTMDKLKNGYKKYNLTVSDIETGDVYISFQTTSYTLFLWFITHDYKIMESETYTGYIVNNQFCLEIQVQGEL